MLAGNLRPYEQALAEFPAMRERVDVLLDRIGYLVFGEPLSVLEIGSAQGAALVALHKRGHCAVGVEPWRPALRTAAQVGAHFHAPMRIAEARAEALPFLDGSFDVVVAFNVLEHVEDVAATFREAARVLRPGGVFWFYSVSALHPGNQNEVGGFPLFPWYPERVKRRVLRWVAQHRPDLVGHSEAPALHWWTPWAARQRLREAGFELVLDRWELHTHRAQDSPLRRAFTDLAKRRPLVRLVGDVLAEGCAYAAVKPGGVERGALGSAPLHLSAGGDASRGDGA